MSIDIDSIKRKLLVKYPTFGSIIAHMEVKEMEEIATAGTDGKNVVYNSNFLNKLSEKEQIFIFAHELCHIAFKHRERREGKDKRIWNMATDAVINALLQKDGLPIVKNGVDIPEAINYDAEQMYNKLLEEQKKQQQEQKQQEQQQDMQDNQQTKADSQNNTEVGHDTHELWDKNIKKDEVKQTTQIEIELETVLKEFAAKGETKIFELNKKERKRNLQQLNKSLARQAGTEIHFQEKKLENIGIAQPLIDWRRLLRQAVKYNEEWSRKNARTRNGYLRHKLEEIPIPETEILLDTSGSVSENLLKNFLKECKNIVSTSKVKVGCFDTQFHGFTELRQVEDIDNMTFPIGGGTDFNAAVNAFSRRVPNKIIFTDGEAPMPEKEIKNLIWVVYGNATINSKSGRVINIKDEQLRKLYRLSVRDENVRG